MNLCTRSYGWFSSLRAARDVARVQTSLPSEKLGEIAVLILARYSIADSSTPKDWAFLLRHCTANFTFLRVLQFKFIYNDNHTTNLLKCGIALEIYTILHCPKGYTLECCSRPISFIVRILLLPAHKWNSTLGTRRMWSQRSIRRKTSGNYWPVCDGRRKGNATMRIARNYTLQLRSIQLGS